MSDEDVTEHAAERRSTPGFFHRRVVLSWILNFWFFFSDIWSNRIRLVIIFLGKQNQVLNYSSGDISSSEVLVRFSHRLQYTDTTVWNQSEIQRRDVTWTNVSRERWMNLYCELDENFSSSHVCALVMKLQPAGY